MLRPSLPERQQFPGTGVFPVKFPLHRIIENVSAGICKVLFAAQYSFKIIALPNLV
jgi:hypothetical protein